VTEERHERYSTDVGIVDEEGHPIPKRQPPPPMTADEQAALDREVEERLAAVGVRL
jgi:hypothetical protein